MSEPVCSMPPTCPAAMARAGGIPNSAMLPESGLVRPSTMSSVVVLPAPFGPRMATVSPRGMLRSIESTASSPPYDLDRQDRTTPPSEALPAAMANRLPCHGLAL